MSIQNAKLLTTGQAAKLCSVTPDTVLKWIKKGKLRATRTAGGHFRISDRDIEVFRTVPAPRCDTFDLPEELPQAEGQEVPCWEYLGEKGEVRDDCKQCVVYRVRATRCFLMAGMEPEVGHARQFCEGSCEDCLYFRRLQSLSTKVLFVTDDDGLTQTLECGDTDGILIKFARNGYEASAIVEDLRPAVAIIDVENLLDLGAGLLDSLAADARLPGVKVILVAPPSAVQRIYQRPRHRLVASILEKPLVCDRLAEVVRSTAPPERHGRDPESPPEAPRELPTAREPQTA
jgi:excisionase family DNA binding protein